ncbi:MAG: hypothetical protein U1F11_08070 [Steroidobacteraceae bacterium]
MQQLARWLAPVAGPAAAADLGATRAQTALGAAEAPTSTAHSRRDAAPPCPGTSRCSTTSASTPTGATTRAAADGLRRRVQRIEVWAIARGATVGRADGCAVELQPGLVSADDGHRGRATLGYVLGARDGRHACCDPAELMLQIFGVRAGVTPASVDAPDDRDAGGGGRRVGNLTFRARSEP